MLKRKDIWDEIQMSQATRKARDLSRADTVKTTAGKRNGSAADAFKKEYGKDSVPAGYDVDHVIDLQLGGRRPCEQHAPPRRQRQPEHGSSDTLSDKGSSRRHQIGNVIFE